MPCCKSKAIYQYDVHAVARPDAPNASTDPERASRECNHATPETGLLSFRRDTLVDTFTEPDIRLHVPRIEKNLEVGRKLDIEDLDVCSALPLGGSRWTEASEPESSKNGSSLQKQL